MARLQYSARGFAAPYSSINTVPAWTSVEVSKASLVHAALTVGREHWSAVYAAPPFSTYEAEFRSNLVRAFLMEYARSGRSPYWAASPAYGRESPAGWVMAPGLEPSEKGAVSFFLGMAMTSLLADRLLNVPWILHYSTYGPRFGVSPTSGAGRRLPDFIAFEPIQSKWFQFESKGRSRVVSGKTRIALQEAAKEQARVKLVYRGTFADLRVASITDFDAGMLRVEWLDPPNDQDIEPIGLDSDPATFILEYYRLLINVLGTDPAEEQQERAERLFRTIRLEHADLRIGLDAALFDAAREGDSDRLLASVSEPRRPIEWGHTYVGRDGVLVELGRTWTAGERELGRGATR